ncbi:MAG: BMP family ABC transporter substrate-binding protein [Chloroflexaceae bacterium]|nr:BMP family ABC transporter substrate-binding protein [Chloroflexaceae bacterium]
MRKSTLVALVVMVIAAVILPACGGTAAPAAACKAGLVTDVGKINDGTFNQYAFDGLKKAETDLGIGIKYIETQAQTDYGKNIQSLVEANCEIIVAVGFMMGDAVAEASGKYPETKFAIVDFAYDPALPNVRGLVFAEDQAGYMAGALAASMSQSGTIAAVGGMEIPPVQKFLKGYEAGAKSINADIAVKSVYIDSFVDRARGAEAAKSFMSEGADVIFGAGGQTGSGGIQAAAEAGIYVIGVDQDEYVTTFQNGAAPGSDKIISSAMKRVDQAVFLTIAKMDEILKGLADGSITTGVTLN